MADTLEILHLKLYSLICRLHIDSMRGRGMSWTTKTLMGRLVVLACFSLLPAAHGQTMGRTIDVHPSLEMEISSAGMEMIPANPLRAGELWIIPAGTRRVSRIAEVDGRRGGFNPSSQHILGWRC